MITLGLRSGIDPEAWDREHPRTVVRVSDRHAFQRRGIMWQCACGAVVTSVDDLSLRVREDCTCLLCRPCAR